MSPETPPGSRRSAAEMRAEREQKEAKGIMVLVIVATMLFAITESLGWYQNITQLDAFPEMARMLFGHFIVPFEVLGFLLLAGLIGALYLATKEGTRRV